MLNRNYLFFLASLLISTLAVSQKKDLVGSWEILSFIDHDNGSTEWEEYDKALIIQKHITPTHFTWLQYNPNTDQLVGLGGGSYIINKDGNYVENIEYFYPPGSSELGQSIPFDVKIEDGIWYHTGYAKRMEINGLGLLISTDSVKIEEKWSPIAGKTENNKDLVGTWNLERFRNDSEKAYMYYPKYMGYLKLVTPTHFVWVQYNKDGDEIFASGSGLYEFAGDGKYVEHLQTSYPGNSNIKGTSIKFDIAINEYIWKHFGYVPRNDGKPNGNDNMIDEFWVPHKSDLDEDTAFMNQE